MTASALPILPTTVVGSYAIPAWLWAAYEKIEAGGFGVMDVAETENDAVATAVRDQERAGVDLISDGEMRRQGFIVSIFKYFRGLRAARAAAEGGYPLLRRPRALRARRARHGARGARHAQGARLPPPRDDAAVQDHAAWSAHARHPGHEGRARTGTGWRSPPTWRRSSIESCAPSQPAAPATSRSTDRLPELHHGAEADGRALRSLLRGRPVERRFWHICFGTLEGFGFGERPTGRCSRPVCGSSADQARARVRQPRDGRDRAVARIRLPEGAGRRRLDLKNFYVESAGAGGAADPPGSRERAGGAALAQPGLRPARLPRHLAFAKLQALVAGARARSARPSSAMRLYKPEVEAQRFWNPHTQTMPRADLDRAAPQEAPDRDRLRVRARSPMYRNLLDRNHVRPEQIRTMDDFVKRLPFIDKKEIPRRAGRQPAVRRGARHFRGLLPSALRHVGLDSARRCTSRSRITPPELWGESWVYVYWAAGLRARHSFYFPFNWGSSPPSGRHTWACAASAPPSSRAAGSTARRASARSSSTGLTSCWRRRPTRSTWRDGPRARHGPRQDVDLARDRGRRARRQHPGDAPGDRGSVGCAGATSSTASPSSGRRTRAARCGKASTSARTGTTRSSSTRRATRCRTAEVGEHIVTSYIQDGQPLIKYRTHDLVR